MTSTIGNSYLLAEQQAVQFTEWSYPQLPWEWALLLTVVILLIGGCFEIYRRDTHELSVGWRIFLPLLRLATLIGLLIVFLNPRTRTQTWAERPSRVAVLVDVSSSMQNPADDPTDDAAETTAEHRSRAAELVALLEQEVWLEQLRQQHEVAIYAFDQSISGRLATLPRQKSEAVMQGNSSEISGDGPPPDWKELFQPVGPETRLGESVTQLMQELNGRTLAGLLVVTDGGNNAGTDLQATNDLARQLNVRLFALGTGGTEPPVNIEVAKVVSPSDVQLGDPFDIVAYVRGEGIAGQTVPVELLTRPAGSEEEYLLLAEQDITILEDRTPVQITFPRTPTEAGEAEYLVRIATRDKEIKQEDNERIVTVNASERPVKVLVFAGGPSWDYRFMCGVLKRHPGFEIDGYLQTGTVGISQDVDNLLFEFPDERSALYEYDVVVCFDPDWLAVPEKSRLLFEQWVSEEGGGAVFVAGDIHTPLLASSREELAAIDYLYPVYLDTILPGIDMVSASTQNRPIELTPEGRSAPLLQVTEDPQTSETFWTEFEGFFRFYPTSGSKTGATIYALAGGASDLGETEPPILLASQFYGQGRTFYIGSPEFYRLRAEDPAYFERFWTRINREAAQNRLRKSNPRGTLLVDQETISLGETIKLRARLLDAEFAPLSVSAVNVEVEQPDGRLIVPEPQLRPDPTQAGRYVGEVRANMQGRYQLRLRLPGTSEQVRESVSVEVPDLENRELRQDVRQLQILTANTGGGYFPLKQADQVVSLLPDSSEQFLLGEQIQTLWDRTWLMLVLIGLFGCEWLCRKLLKLA